MKPIEFKVALEGFVTCQSCVISMDTVGRLQGMTLEDTDHRPLRLSVTSEMLGGTALKVSVPTVVPSRDIFAWGLSKS